MQHIIASPIFAFPSEGPELTFSLGAHAHDAATTPIMEDDFGVSTLMSCKHAGETDFPIASQGHMIQSQRDPIQIDPARLRDVVTAFGNVN
ncbi:hypothetical protein [Pacificibacter marinus]|uniref:hypothetical protein n=1 Tax=Pacificibacter marinus TaxID=658057 RepID=UPI001C0653C2|nr:hypothetical protein [Pacificibacter marinus]MBU2866371.1 hypothetical protein [Pacificibacter marinus]